MGQKNQKVIKALKNVAEKINEILEGRAVEPDKSLSEAGSLLEKALNSSEVGGGTTESPAESTNASIKVTVGESPADNRTFDHMPRDADGELIVEFIAEGGDLISGAEEALHATGHLSEMNMDKDLSRS